MGYYDICQIPLFLAANGKRPVHLTYPFASHHYDSICTPHRFPLTGSIIIMIIIIIIIIIIKK